MNTVRNRYGNGMHYLELHPINDRGRMEAAHACHL